VRRRCTTNQSTRRKPILWLTAAMIGTFAATARGDAGDDAPSIPFDQIGQVAQSGQTTDKAPITVTSHGAILRAAMQDLEAEVTHDGLWITSTAEEDAGRPNRFRVRATKVGRDEAWVQGLRGPRSMVLSTSGQVHATKDVAALVRERLVEEYSVSADGVRQDFVVMQRPSGYLGDLSVTLDITGARATAADYGAKLIVSATGRELAYRRLKVTDSAQRELPARMEVDSANRIRIIVNDAGAVYPVRIDPTFSDADWASMAGPNDVVTALQPDGLGNLYVAGNFTMIGSVSALRIAKWNGSTWSALAAGIPNGTVNALGFAGGKLFAGGSFTSVGGNSALGLAHWDGSSWTPMDLGAALTGSVVHAIAVSGTTVYVGGAFVFDIAFGSNHVLTFDANNIGSKSHLPGRMDGIVRALAVSGSNVYIGGDFTNIGGIMHNRIVRWNGSYNGMEVGVSGGSVRCIAVSGSTVYIGGLFTTASASPVNRVARWNGSSWSALGSGLGAQANAMVMNGTDLYVAGTFVTAGGSAANRIAKWDGTAWSALGSGITGGTPNALCLDPYGRLFVGGSFVTAGGVSSNYLAAAFINGRPEVGVAHPVGTDLVDNVGSVAFGPINQGTTSPAKVFTITNTGAGDLKAIAVTKDGTNAPEYTVNTTGMQTTLAPGASTTFTVTFSPAAQGTRTAAVHVLSTEVGVESSFDIALSGTVSSSNANLSSLVLSAGTLTPAFASATTSYTASVPNSVTSVTVTPTSAHNGAVVQVNNVTISSGTPSGALALSVGNNIITTVVTAEDGIATQTYTVTINRAPSANANLAGLSISAGVLSPAFSAATTSYSSDTFLSTDSTTVTPTVADNTAVVRVNGQIVASGTPGSAISLNPGSNVISVEVTAQDGTTIKTYALTVNRVVTNVADLSALTISAGQLVPAFARPVTSYTTTVSVSNSSLVLTPTVVDPAATVTVNGVTVASGVPSNPIGLALGNNTITTTVTAPNGTTTKSYVLGVFRTAPEIAVELAGTGLTDGNPTPVDYGEISVENTQSFTYTIRNTGNEPLAGLVTSLDGYQDTIDNDGDMQTDEEDESGFVVTAPPVAPVAVNGSTTFVVQFAPYRVGPFNAVLHVTSNDPDEPSFEIHLSGAARVPVRGVISINKPAGSAIVVAEGATVQVPIIRTGGFDGPVGFSIGTQNDSAEAGSDFTPPTVLQNLADGQPTLNVPIAILNPPSTLEPNESFEVTIAAPTGGATLGAVTSVTVRIGDSVDSTSPSTPVITAPAANEIITQPPGLPVTASGTAVDNKGVGSVKVKMNGGSFQEATLADPGLPNTAWSLDLATVEGANTMTVQAFDTKGTPSAVVTRKFTLLRKLIVNADTNLGGVSSGFAPFSSRQANLSYSITATPKPPSASHPVEGSIFTGWSLGGQDVANGNAPFTPQRLGVPASDLQKSKITFIFRQGVELTANFALNPFTSLSGTYNGLIRPSATQPERLPAGIGPEDGSPRDNSTEGFFTATVQSSGAFSGKVTLDGTVLNLAGVFDHEGHARFGTARLFQQSIARTGRPGLIVALRMNVSENAADPTAADRITGTVTTTDLKKSVVLAVSNVDTDRAHYSTGSPLVPAAYLGANNGASTFTAVLPAKDVDAQTAGYDLADYPQGSGVAAISISKTGAVTLTGALADGSTLSASSTLSEIGPGRPSRFPLFAKLYGGKGFLSGFVTLDAAQPDSDMCAENLQWLRPPQNTSHYYPSGWIPPIIVDLVAARYTTENGQSALKMPDDADAGDWGNELPPEDPDGNASLVFAGGQLTADLWKFVNLSASDTVTRVPDNDSTYTLSISRAAGTFNGTFLHTDDTLPAFRGVLYQKGAHAGGYGYFLTKQPTPIDYLGESGAVTIIGEP
jgi:hypothetical protein